MFFTLISFLASPLGKIAAKAIGIALAILTAIGIYFYVRSSIIETERLKIEKQQLEQIVIQKDRQIKQMNDIRDIERAISDAQKDKNQTIENQASKTDTIIDQGKDRESSQVLKDTFDSLYGVK